MRVFGCQSIEVGDVEAAITPGASQVDASTDGRMVAMLIGVGWVEHHPCQGRLRWIPHAYKAIPVGVARAEHRP